MQRGPSLWGPTGLLLLAVALLGIAHVAFLPPFEGYDENAHWSYIQQIADQSRLPPAAKSWLSGDVEDYAGPRPFQLSTPDKPSGAAFRRYFAGPRGDLSQPVPRVYRPTAPSQLGAAPAAAPLLPAADAVLSARPGLELAG